MLFWQRKLVFCFFLTEGVYSVYMYQHLFDCILEKRFFIVIRTIYFWSCLMELVQSSLYTELVLMFQVCSGDLTEPQLGPAEHT